MKRRLLHILMLLSVAVWVVGCNDTPVDYYSTEAGGSVNPSFSIDNDNVSVESRILEQDVAVKSNVWWKAVVEYPDGVRSGEEDWCDVYPKEGLGDVTLKIKMKRNIEEVGRNAVIKLTVDNMTPEGQATQEIKVEQKASEQFIEINHELFAMGKMRADTVILVSANVDYKVEVSTDDGSDTWISLPAATGGGKGLDTRIPIKIATNTEGPRTGSFKVSDVNGVVAPVTVTVTQLDEFQPIDLTYENSDKGLILQWTTDPSFLTYDVIVSVINDPDNVITTINTAADSVNLMDYEAVRNYSNFAIDVRVKGRTVEPEHDRFSTSTWSTNTMFGDGGGDGSSEAQAFVIANMRHFINMPKAGLAGYFKQTVDIDLTEWSKTNTYEPFGTKDAPFIGGYNGQDHRIIGLSLIGNLGKTQGIWGRTGAGAEIKNIIIEKGVLKLTGASLYMFDQEARYGLLVGSNDGGTITNVHLVDPSVTTDYSTVCGGLVGLNRGIIENCTTNSSSTEYRISELKSERLQSANTWVGGLVGINWPGATIRNCANLGTSIYFETGGSDNAQPVCIGGIVGGNDGVVELCYNKANFTTGPNAAQARTGGISGSVIMHSSNASNQWRDDDGQAFTTKGSIIRKCFNSGNIDASTIVYAGGIIGDMISSKASPTSLLVDECYNTGNITMSVGTSYEVYVGGLVGRFSCTMTNCYNTGNITINGGSFNNAMAIGGVGGLAFVPNATLSKCYNVGSIAWNATYGGSRVLIGGMFGSIQYVSNATSVKLLDSYVKSDCVVGGIEKTTPIFTPVTPGSTPTVAQWKLFTKGELYGCIDILPFPAENVTSYYKDDADMRNQATYVGWDFASVWRMNGGYPELINVVKEQ